MTDPSDGDRPRFKMTSVGSALSEEPKSLALALVLSFLFGPIGLLYVSWNGAVIMFLVNGVTMLLGAILLNTPGTIVPTWLLCMLWAGIGTVRYNRELRNATAEQPGRP